MVLMRSWESEWSRTVCEAGRVFKASMAAVISMRLFVVSIAWPEASK